MPTVRRLVASDRYDVVTLIATGLLDEPDPTAPSDETAAADFRALNAELDRHLAGDSDIYFAVATDDTGILGVAATSQSFMARPGVWEIGWQVVRSDRRRQGLGIALLRAVEAFARDQGAEILLLSSGEPDHHRQAGYRVVARSLSEIVLVKSVGSWLE